MFWTIIDRMVSLAFLLLSITIICFLLETHDENTTRDSLSLQIVNLETSIKKVMSSNLTYIEGRVNNVAKAQDDYQVTTDSRLTILDVRLRAMEQENKSLKTQSRVINNNNSNAVINTTK